MRLRPKTVVWLVLLCGSGAGSMLVLTGLQRVPAIQIPAPEADVLELNQASVIELATIPGIGPALAKRIIAYREVCEGFNRVEDLSGVKGIGKKTLARIRTYVRVQPKQ